MKRSMRLTLMLLLLTYLLSACGQKQDSQDKTEESKAESQWTENFSQKGHEIIALFGQDAAYYEILQDVADIDLYLEPDFDNPDYEEKTIVDEETDTAIHQYYMNDVLLFEKGEGYGEDFFAYYTQTRNGLDARVSYFVEDYGDDGIYTMVMIETDAYHISYDNPDEAKPLNEQDILITVSKDGKQDLEESMAYRLKDGAVLIDYAFYHADQGYMAYYSWMDESGQKLEEKEELEFEDFAGESDDTLVNEFQDDPSVYAVAALLGPHKLKEENGKWYIKCNLYVIFTDEGAAKAYADSKGFANDSIGNDYLEEDGYCYLTYEDITCGLAEDFICYGDHDLAYFAQMEYDDWSFAKVTFNDRHEIAGIDYGVPMSYY